MLDHHSSRWSAAASPGGLIGLILTSLSVAVLVTAVLSLTGRFDLNLDQTVLYSLLGVSTFTTIVLLYLLVSYVTIRYRMDGDKLTFACGLWQVSIPYDEVEAVAPAAEVPEALNGGWQPYWPGYYVGSRETDIGKVQVLATLPAQHQVLIKRSNDEIYAISPEHPLLFMEELDRWHCSYVGAEAADDTASPAVAEPTVEEPTEPISSENEPVQPADWSSAEILPHPVAESAPQPEPEEATEAPQEQPEPGPVFGHRSPADHGSSGEAKPEPPAAEQGEPRPQFREVPEYVGPPIPDEPEHDTARFQILGAGPDQNAVQSLRTGTQQPLDTDWAVAALSEQVTNLAVAPPKPIILPAGLPRSEVLQPLTRAQYGDPSATSPAIRPTIHRDPVSLSLVGVGALAAAAMATYILVQYQDLPQTLTFHWDVEGSPARVAGREGIWALPVIAALLLIANVGLAWSIAQFDRFASRLMLASTLVAQVIIWIALFMIIE